jgi:hypothetical protein
MTRNPLLASLFLLALSLPGVIKQLRCTLFLLFFVWPACAIAGFPGLPADTSIENSWQSPVVIPFAFNTGEWTTLGRTEVASAPYDFYYYKLLQVNAAAHRYASILEVSVQGDANYYGSQATYRIRVDKYENTPARFDGLEISCISGNPYVAVFYVYNDALWIRSTRQWGGIYYRTVADFTGSSPLTTSPHGQTTTAPVGYLTATADFGLKCDFDNNKYYQLPHGDAQGNLYMQGNLNLVSNSTVNSNAVRGLNSTWLFGWNGPSGNEDISIGTQDQTGARTLTLSAGGFPRMKVLANGNIGIGTTTPGSYKLAVEGTIGARKMKVTQANWADFVFDPEYRLPSLQEVERFVKTHKHLPDIPSAKEVVEEGIDLGEMNKRLLQKIEEQMLYIIELNKMLKAQGQRIEQLERITSR